MVSPKITAVAAAAKPLLINRLTRSKTATILTVCSKICVRALGETRRSAIKYPLTQEEIPINGNENAIILSEGSALMSPMILREINSAPKYTSPIEIRAITRVSSTERRKIFRAPFFEPSANSSVMSLVTAVLIPLVAKVDANI